MGGSSKAGGASTATYNVFGDLTGVLCRGPLYGVRAVLHDGKAIWEGVANFTSDVVDLTTSIDPKWFYGASSYLRIYRGTETQPVDTVLGGGPAYRGWAYLVADGLLFGQQKNTAPNLQVEWVRLPQCPTALVEAAHNVLDSDEQVNPVAFLAELLHREMGVPLAEFAASSWLSAGAWCADTSRRPTTFCSPLLTRQQDLRGHVAELLAMFDGALRRDAQGRLDLVMLRYGEAPGTVTTLDARHLTKIVDWKATGPSSLPTGMVCRFVDGTRQFKESDEVVQNLLATTLRPGVVQTERLSVPHVTRRVQAARLGEIALRRAMRPSMEATLEVAAEVAVRPDGEALLPGDKLWVDIDPVPNGTGLAGVAHVTQREEDMGGTVRLRVKTDATVPALPYAPEWTGPGEDADPVEPIAHALVVALPPGGWGWPPQIGVLATRPADDVSGLEILYDQDVEEGVFPRLGEQAGYACRATLDAGVAADATVLRLSLPDGATGRDAYLVAEGLPSSALEARNEGLLAVIANLTSNRVVVTDGVPEMELLAIVSRATVDTDTHDYTVLRGRRGLGARAWTTSAAVWLVPSGNLVAWTHRDFVGLTRGAGAAYLRLRPVSRTRTNEETTLLERRVDFPASYETAPRLTWSTPSGSSANTDTAGAITVAGEVEDSSADLVGLRVDTWENVTPEVVTKRLDDVFARTGMRTWSVPLVLAGHSSEYRYYTVRTEARDEAGNVVSQTRQIVRLPTGSPTGLLPPTMDPPGGWFDGTQIVTLTRSGAATEIHWLIDSTWGAEPTSGWAVSATNPQSVTLFRSGRLWARASTGTVHSAWVWADFSEDDGGGGGYIEP